MSYQTPFREACREKPIEERRIFNNIEDFIAHVRTIIIPRWERDKHHRGSAEWDDILKTLKDGLLETMRDKPHDQIGSICLDDLSQRLENKFYNRDGNIDTISAASRIAKQVAIDAYYLEPDRNIDDAPVCH